MAGLATHEIKTKKRKMAMIMVMRELLVAKQANIFLALCAGLVIEFSACAIDDLHHWTIAQPVKAVLYCALCLFIFRLFSKGESLRLAVLSLTSGLYGVANIITLSGTNYTLLNGIIWHDVVNFDLIYRAIEVAILASTLWDLYGNRVINIVRNALGLDDNITNPSVDKIHSGEVV